ncbi:MAG: histidinol-phosphate transaminase [Clostridiales bacterium]|jgi:histidinol-phosphate aminotransferase|nr:histidinol-phosphate transaminase [Clostridiales bacterium]
MSRYLSSWHKALTPYVPGEQPRGSEYIKLNTNESPFQPSPGVIRAASGGAAGLNLYCDPACNALCEAAAALYGVEKENVLPLNGSDEGLCFAFLAFCSPGRPVAYPDVTYGFYPVLSRLNNVPEHLIPLKDDYTVDVAGFVGIDETIFIANPNAPTGMALAPESIEKIVRSNPDNVVVIDEAYVDFGAESCVPLIKKYDNLLVLQTFSKSRSMAGARLGFAIGSAGLIGDLNAIKYSINPYNVNSMTQAAGIAAIADNEYYMGNCNTVAITRESTAAELAGLGFHVLPSRANFIFASSDRIDGEELYLELKSRGILVRHFGGERVRDFIRISIGTAAQMDTFLSEIRSILEVRS